MDNLAQNTYFQNSKKLKRIQTVSLLSFLMSLTMSLLSCFFLQVHVDNVCFIFMSRTGTFDPKMDIIKDRNGKDLIEAEEIKKRWQEYTEELYKKDLNDPDNHDGVVSHPEPDIRECEVKCPLGSTTAIEARGDGIPAELFEILKDDAI